MLGIFSNDEMRIEHDVVTCFGKKHQSAGRNLNFVPYTLHIQQYFVIFLNQQHALQPSNHLLEVPSNLPSYSCVHAGWNARRPYESWCAGCEHDTLPQKVHLRRLRRERRTTSAKS